MSLKIDINMCRICMKTNDGVSIYSDNEIIKKLKFCTQLEILKTDDLPKSICNKCVGRLEVAYIFRKQAEYSDKYLRQLITHHKEELNQSALGKQCVYYEMVLEIFRKRIKVEQDDQIEQMPDFESEEVSIVNLPSILEDINCKGTDRMTDSVPVYAEIEEADIEKIPETKQINLFTIEKVTSIPKTEFNQANEISLNESSSQEDIEPVSYDTQIKVEQGDQMKQQTDVKSVKISETIEEGIQYKRCTCGADIAKIEEIEKMQKTIFTIAKLTSFRKKEDDQTDKFECVVCGAHFTRKSSLNRHLLTHSGEPRYKCAICDRGFTRSTTLSTHLMQHTGEKPFACEICGTAFRYQRSLKRHVLKHEDQNKAEVKIKVLKLKEQRKRQLQMRLARETPEKAALRRKKEAAKSRKQRFRAKQQSSNK